MLRHLMFKGGGISVPICGDNTISKVVVFTESRTTCEACKSILSKLLEVDSYAEASTVIPISLDNLEEHSATASEFYKSVIGNKDTFWANIQKFEQ